MRKEDILRGGGQSISHPQLWGLAQPLLAKMSYLSPLHEHGGGNQRCETVLANKSSVYIYCSRYHFVAIFLLLIKITCC